MRALGQGDWSISDSSLREIKVFRNSLYIIRRRFKRALLSDWRGVWPLVRVHQEFQVHPRNQSTGTDRRADGSDYDSHLDGLSQYSRNNGGQ